MLCYVAALKGLHSADFISFWSFKVNVDILRIEKSYYLDSVIHFLKKFKSLDFISLSGSFCQGPVVQSIVILTTSFRCQFIKYMLTILSNPLLFFVEKNVRIFCSAKDSHIFSNK